MREPLMDPTGGADEENSMGCPVIKTRLSYEEAEKLLSEKRMKGKIAVEKVMQFSREELKRLLVAEGLTSSQAAKRLNTKLATVHILRKLFDLQEKDIQGERNQLNYASSGKDDEGKDEDAIRPDKDESHNSTAAIEEVLLSGELDETDEPIIKKFIFATGKVAAGELMGTAKALDRMGDKEVTVEVRIWE